MLSSLPLLQRRNQRPLPPCAYPVTIMNVNVILSTYNIKKSYEISFISCGEENVLKSLSTVSDSALYKQYWYTLIPPIRLKIYLIPIYYQKNCVCWNGFLYSLFQLSRSPVLRGSSSFFTTLRALLTFDRMLPPHINYSFRIPHPEEVVKLRKRTRCVMWPL